MLDGLVFKMKLVFFLAVCPTLCKMSECICTLDPLQILHKYYQPGNLIVGEITSQLFSMFESMSFEEHPNKKLIEESM